MTNQTQQTSQENTTQSSMKETTFKDLLSQVQFVVPEIQREYVWGSNKDIIENFIKSIKEENSLNIGFLYSYTPNYATSEQKISYLIDGQQRFTTLYLLAFYISLKENKYDDFKSNSHRFSYRVRHSTAQFLEKFVTETKIIEDFKNIEDKTWFLSYYKQDISISNVLALIKLLSEYTNELPSYEQIMAVKFHNFNIAATGQGEELYISMNSRGEKIQDNENLRAKLFEKVSDNKERVTRAKEYDNWQEFFWRNRGSNSSADVGFNAFIRLVIAIEFYMDFSQKEEKNDVKLASFRNAKDVNVNVNHYYNLLTFAKLKYYFLAFRNIAETIYSEKNKTLFAKLISKEEKGTQKPLYENIFSDSISHSYFMFILPLLCMAKSKNDYKLSLRFIRFFYNIAFNKESQAVVSSLDLTQSIKEYTDPIQMLALEGKNTLLDDEEKDKLKIYRDSSQREEVEKAFYQAEDMKLWTGEISSQISWSKDFNNTFSLDKFSFLNELFKFLFENEPNKDLLRRALLARKLENYPISFHWNTKFSFISKIESWKTLFSQEKNKKFFLELFEEIYRNYIASENNFEKSLQQIISTPSEGVDKYHIELIKRPEPLAYCQNKIALWADETGWKLLTKTKTNSYSIHLNTYILFLDGNEIFKNELYHYKNINGREIYIGKYEQDESCVYFNLLDDIAVDVSCTGIDNKFIIEVFSRSNQGNELSSAERLDRVGKFLKYELNSGQRLELPELSYDETILILKNIFGFFSL